MKVCEDCEKELVGEELADAVLVGNESYVPVRYHHEPYLLCCDCADSRFERSCTEAQATAAVIRTRLGLP